MNMNERESLIGLGNALPTGKYASQDIPSDALKTTETLVTRVNRIERENHQAFQEFSKTIEEIGTRLSKLEGAVQKMYNYIGM